MSATQVSVSVVIPTRDRPADLARCLGALARQRGAESIEVIVVDDGSADTHATAAAVAACPSARLLRLDGRGPAAARNAGVAATHAPIVCFTDDDCEPAPDWAARLAAAIRGGAAAAGGTTLNGAPEDSPATATQLIIRWLIEVATQSTSEGRFTPSNNLACRRDVLERVPFDERYPFAGGEDREWCARLAESGYELASEPAAVVLHSYGETLTGFWRRHLRYGRGSYLFRGSRRDAACNPRAALMTLLAHGFGEGVEIGLLVCLAQLATVAGFCAEAARSSLVRHA